MIAQQIAAPPTRVESSKIDTCIDQRLENLVRPIRAPKPINDQPDLYTTLARRDQGDTNLDCGPVIAKNVEEQPQRRLGTPDRVKKKGQSVMPGNRKPQLVSVNFRVNVFEMRNFPHGGFLLATPPRWQGHAAFL